MLAEIKTEAARHRAVALFSESPDWNPLYLFSVCVCVLSLSLSPPCLSLCSPSLSLLSPLSLPLLSLSLPPSLPPSLPLLAVFPCSLFSLPLPLMHIRCHIPSTPLFSVLTLKPSGAFARQQAAASPASFSHVCSSAWSSVPFQPFHSYKRLKGGVTLLPCSFLQEGLKRDNKN